MTITDFFMYWAFPSTLIFTIIYIANATAKKAGRDSLGKYWITAVVISVIWPMGAFVLCLALLQEIKARLIHYAEIKRKKRFVEKIMRKAEEK